jgi:RNA polymerase sigma-70 factor (ECF subfamily)
MLRIGITTMTTESIHWRLLPTAWQGLEDEPRVDSESFERTWSEAAADIARLIRALGHSGARADDACQEVYLAGREKRPAGLSPADLRRWLMRVAANRCRLMHREQKRWTRVLERLWQGRNGAEDSPHDGSAQQSVEQVELEQGVEAALGKLKPVEREIVVLRYFANFDSAEIGQMLSMNNATVRSHLVRARKELARELAEWGEVRSEKSECRTRKEKS